MSQLPIDPTVCADCLSGDKVLQDWLQEHDRTQKCCFCGGENRPALPVKNVAKKVLKLLDDAGYEPYVLADVWG